MTTYRASNDTRLIAAIGAGLVQALGLWVLISGFAVAIPHVVSRDLALFGVLPDPPPPPTPEKPRPRPSKRAEAAAAPPNLRAKPTEIVAPPPEIRMPVPSPIIAAPIVGLGNQARAGAADVAGPGTGAGGVGNGLGSGGSGDGDGGGGSEAYQKSGRIKDSDFPPGIPPRWRGTVYVSFTVETDGRATACVVRHTSGNREIDATTCRLVEERYRYEPARDARGKKIRSRVENQDHTWISAHGGGPDDDD